MEFRPATTSDLPAQEAAFRAAIGELYVRHNLPPPNPPSEAFRAQHRHLLRHDGNRCWVAEEEGRVIGFSAAMARGHAWHLASLFVVPERQGAGLGKQLLELAWGEGYTNRRTLADAIQPVSNGLYAGRGLIPTVPILHLGGAGRVDDPGLEPADTTPETLAELDRAGYGFDRAADHVYWSDLGRCTVWLRHGEPSAYSYGYPWGQLGPVVGVDGSSAAEALGAELIRHEGTVSVVVPGSSRELVDAAIQAGLRFTRPPGLLLLGPGVEAPRALAISGYSLY